MVASNVVSVLIIRFWNVFIFFSYFLKTTISYVASHDVSVVYYYICYRTGTCRFFVYECNDT